MPTYATTLQLGNSLGIVGDVPNNAVGATPALEVVGTGDNSATIFYLDQRNIISGTQIISSGTSEAAATALTLTTDYTINLTTGRITLTAAGVTAVGTDTIFAEYQHFTLNVKDSSFSDVLDEAVEEVNSMLNTEFTDGTVTNPDYPAIVQESHPTQGQFDRRYFIDRRPLIDVESLLDSTITAVATTLDVTTGDGANFPSSGRIVIENEIITYTGVSTDTLTGLTRGVGDSDSSAHTAGVEIHTTIVEISGESEGTAPTFFTQQWKSQTFVNQRGLVFIYDTQLTDNVTAAGNLLHPLPDVENRLLLSYLHGFSTIPVDIRRLTLLVAKQILVNDSIMKSIVGSRDEFRPNVMNAEQMEINRIAGRYMQIAMANS